MNAKSIQPGKYFNYVQSYQHHKIIPNDGINLYSFSINPEDHQPSGTCNMSRIDHANLYVNYDDYVMNNLTNTQVSVYTINYNILRIMNGLGGLAYI